MCVSIHILLIARSWSRVPACGRNHVRGTTRKTRVGDDLTSVCIRTVFAQECLGVESHHRPPNSRMIRLASSLFGLAFAHLRASETSFAGGAAVFSVLDAAAVGEAFRGPINLTMLFSAALLAGT